MEPIPVRNEPPELNDRLRFIDLFAGLGGFHQALASLGHECVFACEIDPELAELYEKNFGMRPHGDIRTAHPQNVPPHDVLCAGFPCQNYSKAGDQLGLKCPRWGDLVSYIVAISATAGPECSSWRMCPTSMRHRGGETWRRIRMQLEDAGYSVSEEKLSPDAFGVPQVRERAFIVGRRGGLRGFQWPGGQPPEDLSVKTVLDQRPAEAGYLEPHHIEYLNAWQKLIDALPTNEPLPTWPIWAMEFGATYPYVMGTPHARGFRGLGRYAGTLGKSLAHLDPDEVKEALPSYAQESAATFPDWKIEFIRKISRFLPTSPGRYRRMAAADHDVRAQLSEAGVELQRG